MSRIWLIVMMLVALAIAACSQDEVVSGVEERMTAEPTSESSVDEVESSAANAQQPEPTDTLTTEREEPSESAEVTRIETSPTATPPTPENGPAKEIIETIEVTYFTPSQGEGPYYTVDKPLDRDNDLTVVTGTQGTAVGEVIEFGGKVYDASGIPIPGIVVEIWQTDASGVYLHPNDPSTGQRDVNFQSYGEAVSGPDGSYGFRTILPGRYEPRPRHIHVKVKFEGQELLTTQFYFEGDPQLDNEAMFVQANGAGQHLIISLQEGTDASGSPILLGKRDIILNVDLSSR